MENVREIILKCYSRLMKEKNIEITPTTETMLSRDSGIDSLGIVTLILDIEEELGVELDSYLADIRKCKTLFEMMRIIENAVQ